MGRHLVAASSLAEVPKPMIVFVYGDHSWCDDLIREAKCSNNHQIATLEMVRRGTIDYHLARTFLETNGVGFDPRTCCDVPNGDLLTRNNVRLLEQHAINADA